MVKHLITITAVDLTDVPPDRRVVYQSILNASSDKMKVLKKRAQKLFKEEGDGNDSYHTIKVVELGSNDVVEPEHLARWLDDFAKEMGD